MLIRIPLTKFQAYQAKVLSNFGICNFLLPACQNLHYIKLLILFIFIVNIVHFFHWTVTIAGKLNFLIQGTFYEKWKPLIPNRVIYVLWEISITNNILFINCTSSSVCNSYLYESCLCVTIIDVDECDINLHGCDGKATCSDTDGSYTCTCNDGYTGDGFTCQSKSLIRFIFFREYCIFKFVTKNFTVLLSNAYKDSPHKISSISSQSFG